SMSGYPTPSPRQLYPSASIFHVQWMHVTGMRPAGLRLTAAARKDRMSQAAFRSLQCLSGDRPMAPLNLVLMLTLVVVAGDDPAEKGDPDGKRESAQRVLNLARQYEFFAGSDRRTKFELQSKPLLTYSNPVRGDVHGNVFVWTRKGRPVVVGAFFDFRSEN